MPGPKDPKKYKEWRNKLLIAARNRSPEHCRKISIAKKGKPSSFKGKKHTAEAKLKNRLAHLGKPSWAKGKTKETDIRIRKIARKVSKTRKELFKKNPKFRENAKKGGYACQKKHKNTGKNLGQWVKDNPQHSSKIARRTHRIYPDLASRMGKITQKKYPDFMSKIMKKYYKEIKNDPEKYLRFKRWSKKGGRKGGISTQKKHPNLASEIGQRTSEKLRNKKGFIWKGVCFDSKAEMEIARLLIPNPQKNVNVQVRVGSKTIDFFPERFIFVEYHPWDRNKTLNEYYQERKKAIQNSEYKDTLLFVITRKDQVSAVKEVIKSFKKLIRMI